MQTPTLKAAGLLVAQPLFFCCDNLFLVWNAVSNAYSLQPKGENYENDYSITCGLCKHHTVLEVANLIAVVVGDTTAHEVRQRARCHNCGVKGNNTYQMV